MKRILYIGGFELPDKNAAAQRVISNGKALRSLGHDVMFVGLTKSVPKSYRYQNFECREIVYPEGKRAWISFLLSIREESKFIEEYNPDVLILYNYPAFKFLFLKNKYKKKIIIADVTEWYEASGLSLFSTIKRLDVWLRMKIIHPRINGLIVISDYLEAYYKNKVEKVINIPPLVDVDEEKWKSEKKQISKESYNLVYAGSPGAGNKDRLDLLISALEKVRIQTGKDIHIDIIGLTKQEYIINFGKSPTENLSAAYIHFHGRVSHSAALEYVKNADYSIFLRNNNLTNTAGFPTKFVESITAGTPVLTNASSNLSNYFVKHSEIGYLIPSLAESDIASGIELAVSNSKEEVYRMKEYCSKSNLFFYNRYEKDFKDLLDG